YLPSYVHNHTPHSFPTRRSSDLTELNIAPGIKMQLHVYSDDIVVRERISGNSDSIMRLARVEQSHTRRSAHGSTPDGGLGAEIRDRKSTRLNSSHSQISYAVFCL